MNRPVGADLHPSTSDDDAFGAQELGLLALVAGHQPAGDVDDPPPRDVERGRRQDPTHEARPLRVAGDVGDVAVRGHLAGPERQDHVDDSSFAVVHGTILAAS